LLKVDNTDTTVQCSTLHKIPSKYLLTEWMNEWILENTDLTL
jgi:hypothetical protein